MNIYPNVVLSTGMDVFFDTTSTAFLKEMDTGLDMSFKQPNTEDKVTVDDVQAFAVMKYKFHEVKTQTTQESSGPTMEDLQSTKGENLTFFL